MEKKSQFEGDRIAKVLARAGVCSRRDAERMIADGRVAVNGRKLATPALNVTPSDHITVDGKPVGEPDPPRLWRYHKPAGLVTTNRDPQGRDIPNPETAHIPVHGLAIVPSGSCVRNSAQPGCSHGKIREI